MKFTWLVFRGLTGSVTTNHYHLSSTLGVGIPEQRFIFDFAPLPLEVTRPINLPCTQK